MPVKSVRTPPQPMVPVAFFVVVGLCFGWFFDVDIWVASALGFVAILLYMAKFQSIVLPFIVFCIGLMATTIWRSGGESLDGRSELLSIHIIGHNRAYVDSYRTGGGEWRGVRQQLYFGADSTLVIMPGDRVTSYCRVREIGQHGYIYLSERNTHIDRGQMKWSTSVNEWACERLETLGLTHDALTLVKSMLLGRRELMSEELSNNYKLSGAAHLLAISGLHMAIIFMMLNMFFRICHLIPYGHVARHILVIVALWGYASVVGMGVSVVRAAAMLTVLQCAHMLHRSYSSLNALCFVIMVMLLLNPSSLFDVGFLLSVIAVFAIILWGIPILHLIGYKIGGVISNFVVKSIVNPIVSVMVIGVVCSVAVMPLLSYTFGYVSIWGVLLNPLVVTTSYLILTLSLLWVLFGVGLFSPLFSTTIEGLANIQNHAVASFDSAIDLRLELWEVVAVYTIYIIITFTLNFAQSIVNPNIIPTFAPSDAVKRQG